MRVIGRFLDEEHVNKIVGTLRNIGFKDEDMIISNISKEEGWNTSTGADENMLHNIQEVNGLSIIKTFTSETKGMKGEGGIIVTVKTPKFESDKIKWYMEQAGAVEIILE